MSWLYERRFIESAKSGRIKAERFMGHWTVTAGGNSQSCKLLDDLWKNAFRRVPSDAHIKRILMLGLGTGSTLSIYAEQFPGARIVAIERDEEMVKLMDAFHKPWKRLVRPEVLIGDAQEILPTLSGAFELIVSDMFDGKRVVLPSVPDVARLLHPHGFLFVNGFTQPETFKTFETTFVQEQRWKFKTNWVALYRPHGAGVLGDTLPKGYEYYAGVPAYIEREYGKTKSRLALFFGDSEPKPQPGRGPRFILWNPTTRTKAPKGWLPFPLSGRRRKTGFAQIDSHDAYWERWYPQAQRHRAEWIKQTALEAIQPTPEEYLSAYAQSGMRMSLVRAFSQSLKRRAKTHPGLTRLFAARRKSDGRLIAGLAVLDIPETRTSVHMTSFLHPDGRKTPAGTGLIEEWFRDSQQRGIRFLDFDGFWAPGDPKSWQGYSGFKSQFGVRFIRYPKPFWKIIL